MTRKSTFLNEYKDIKIDLFDPAQKDFIYDLLIQASLKNFEYEYNGERLNIIDVNADNKANAIHIIFQTQLQKYTKQAAQQTTKRGRTQRVKERMMKKHIVTGYMTERIRKKYNLNIGDVFENAEHLLEWTGLGESVLTGWINKKWIEVRD